MSFRVTVVLLVVVVALGGVVFFVDQNPPTPTPSGAGLATVMSFLSSDATQLEAAAKDQSVVVARDPSGGWLLQKPEAAPADQLRVESIIASLAALSATRTLTEPGDLAQFGLAEPALTVKVSLKSGATKTLLLGDQSPDKAGYYAKLPDASAVYLIAASDGADLTQLMVSPPKATPTPTPPPADTPGPGTPTAVPPAGAVAPSAPPPPAAPPLAPAESATSTPEPDALPPQAVFGTPVIPDVPPPPEELTPTPAP